MNDAATAFVPASAVHLSGENLINDLDLKITGPGGTTFLPWLPDPAHPAAVAGTGQNRRDNVEQIEIPNPVAGGAYTVEVSPFGAVTGSGGQPFSLTLSGLQSQPAPPFRIVDFQRGGSPGQYSLLWPAVPGAVYRLESSANLQTWQELSADYVASQPMISAVVTAPAGAGRQFYRVRRMF